MRSRMVWSGDLLPYEDEIRSVEGPAQTGAALKEPQFAHPMNQEPLRARTGLERQR